MEPRMYPLPPSPTPSDQGGRVDVAGLAHISQQLVASGVISRPLPSNAFSGTLDGQEAVMRCLWKMLANRQDDIALRESMAAKQRTLAYDFTRLQTLLEKANAAKTAAEKEASASTSRASAAQSALTTEQSRHKTTREDLTKARNAERAIKSQALYEARRKEQELLTIQRKYMKLTEAPATASSAPIQLLSSMAVTAPITASSTGRARRGADPKEGEVALLEASLAESERRRSEATEECIALRKLIEDCETEVLKLVDDVLGGHASLAGGLPGDSGSGAEEDRMVSYPAYDPYTAPMRTLTTRLSTLLFALRDSASVMATSITTVQAKCEEEIEKANSEWEQKEGEWRADKVAMEREIVVAKGALEEAEKVIEGWVANGVPSTEAEAANASADAADSSLLKKAAIFSAKRKERTQAAATVDSTTKASRARKQADAEEQRRQQVASILGELTSPPVEKVPVKADDSRKKRHEEVREKERRERPRPSTESIVVEARPSKPSANVDEVRSRERRRERDEEPRRERERERERVREEHRPRETVKSPEGNASADTVRPASSSRPTPAVVSKPTSTSAHVASLLAAIMSDDTPPPAILASKSPNKRRPASPLARHRERDPLKPTRPREEKGKGVERSGIPKSSSNGAIASSRGSTQLRTSAKENARVEDTAAKKHRVLSSTSADPSVRRSAFGVKDRVRA